MVPLGSTPDLCFLVRVEETIWFDAVGTVAAALLLMDATIAALLDLLVDSAPARLFLDLVGVTIAAVLLLPPLVLLALLPLPVMNGMVPRSPLFDVPSMPPHIRAVMVEMTELVVMLTIDFVTLTPVDSRNEAIVVSVFVKTDENDTFPKKPPIEYDGS